MNSLHIKLDNEWCEIKQPWVKAEGTWHKCKAIYVNDHGVWRHTWRVTAEILPFPVPQRFEYTGVLQDVCTSAA